MKVKRTIFFVFVIKANATSSSNHFSINIILESHLDSYNNQILPLAKECNLKGRSKINYKLDIINVYLGIFLNLLRSTD